MKSKIAGMDLSKRRTYFLIYTLLFVIMALFVWSWFLFSGRSLIWQEDGLSQHYTALLYYAKYLRSVIRTLFEQHTLIFPQWDFAIGEGSDILETLHYYVIGDPFSLFSVFVPTRFMYLYYNFMIMLRIYLAGMAFSCLCFQTGQKSRYGVLAGSITYVFCYWVLLNAARHPYFLNPLLYLPLLLLGVEKILQGKRPYLLILAVFLSGISNFYFFYILTLLTLIYVVVRLILTYRKQVKKILFQFLRIALPAILGILLAAVILLPMLYAFLSDPRMSAGNTYHLFYPLSYYSQLPGLLFDQASPYWMCMGFAAPVLPALILLFRKRGKNLLEKVYFVICLLIMLVPFFGQMFNGFSYMANRWSFAFALVCSYILVRMWPSLMELKKKDVLVLVVGVAAYFAVCLIFDYSRSFGALCAVTFTLLFLFLLYPANEERSWFGPRRKAQIALTALLASVFANSFWLYSYGGYGYAAESLETKGLSADLYTNEAQAIRKVAEDSEETFVRYSGSDLTLNAALREGLSSTQYYWTISNPFVGQFRSELELREYSLYNYSNYDERAALTTLASVLYYVVPMGSDAIVPYGFTYLDTLYIAEHDTDEMLEELQQELHVEELSDAQIKLIRDVKTKSYDVYRNDYALPLVYTYSTSLDMDTYESFSAVEKQEALLQASVLEGSASASVEEGEVTLSSESVPYMVTSEENGVSLSENGDAFVVTSQDATVTLTFDGLMNAETYVLFEGFDYTWVPRYDLYFGDEEVDPLNLYNDASWDLLSYKEKKTIRKEKRFHTEEETVLIQIQSPELSDKILEYYPADYSYYNDRHDFAVNIGYSQDAVTEINIIFPSIGIYHFDSLEVVCQPMDQYETQVAALAEDTLDNLEIGTNLVAGTISLEQDKILCFSIPYSTGWSAIVDGEETELYRTNIMYLGLSLEAGEHTIQLVYHSPFFRTGLLITCIAAMGFVVLIICLELYRKKRNKKQDMVAQQEGTGQ